MVLEHGEAGVSAAGPISLVLPKAAQGAPRRLGRFVAETSAEGEDLVASGQSCGKVKR